MCALKKLSTVRGKDAQEHYMTCDKCNKGLHTECFPVHNVKSDSSMRCHFPKSLKLIYSLAKHYENVKSCLEANVLCNIRTVFCLRMFSIWNSKPNAKFNFIIYKLPTKIFLHVESC
jgi:hypothetical protein